jgi:tetratricopeptide (TPR) repeat protein
LSQGAARQAGDPRLTDTLVGVSDEHWRRAVARLREVRLLAPVDPSDSEALDAHPLVREWFGERLKATNEAAWKEAHGRLYDHLRDTTHEGNEPTLADLSPLYHAVAHGCRAGRHQEALDEVYINRVCRRLPDGQIEFYSRRKLGAVGSDLGAISWFFDKPYEAPSAAITPRLWAWVLGYASAGLRAQERPIEALGATRTALQMEEAESSWRNAAIVASNLSQTERLIGDIAAAITTAKNSVALADRSGNAFQMMVNRATEADALHAAGELERAAARFREAERIQQALQPRFPLLNSVAGYQFCDLLLSQGQIEEVRDRGAQTLQWAHQSLGLLSVGLDTLTLGRTQLAHALRSMPHALPADKASTDARSAAIQLDEAVESLRVSGHNEYAPLGLTSRGTFRRAIGDWNRAKSDLDEAKEIAEPGLMRPYLCDCALERARLALAQREAFAPPNGLVEPRPPPFSPDPHAAAALKEEARTQLDVARKLIAECGYHRRDEELAELDEVVAGGRRFADLPLRV